MTHKFTNIEVLEVGCFQCGARPNEPCTESDLPLLGFHQVRLDLRAKLPVLPTELDSTDKAIVTYYAYIALANSCSAKSLELFGKQFSSEDIQRTFAEQGLIAARKDGLIGAEPAKVTPNRHERRAEAKRIKLIQ